MLQVEQGYRMHLTGDYISNAADFSSSKWLSATELYIDMIKNDLTSEDWTGIFQALCCLEESDEQDSRIQTGAPVVPTQREALLPADPPSSPSAN